MNVTATEAKNRLGQVLEHAQREPVFVDKAGRRHSVVISAAHYDALVAASRPARAPAAAEPLSSAAQAFYDRYGDWVDEQNRHFDKYGVWNEEFRSW